MPRLVSTTMAATGRSHARRAFVVAAAAVAMLVGGLVGVSAPASAANEVTVTVQGTYVSRGPVTTCTVSPDPVYVDYGGTVKVRYNSGAGSGYAIYVNGQSVTSGYSDGSGATEASFANLTQSVDWPIGSSGQLCSNGPLSIKVTVGPPPDLVCSSVSSTSDPTAVTLAWSGGANQPVTVSNAEGLPQTSSPASSSPITVSGLTPGKSYTFSVSDGTAKDGTCASYWVPVTAVQLPTIQSTKVSGTDLQVTYGVPDPAGVCGVEYSIDGGYWAQPGGTAPSGSAGGVFTVPVSKSGSVGLRTVGVCGPGSSGSGTGVYSAAVSTAFTVPPPPKPTTPSGSGTSGSSSSGSNSSSSSQSSSSQSSSSSSGAAAAAAAGARASANAPCLAPDGTLLPDLFGTVGSQLTMAPNTIGLPAASGFALTKGTLPPGMMMDATYGIVYGTPSAPGTWPITVKGTWPDGTTRSSAITIAIAPDNASVQYASRNIANVGTESVLHPAVTADGTYALVCGTLPPGMALNGRTGEITGTPTEVVDYPTPLRVRQSDDRGRTTAAGSFILVVNPAQAGNVSSIAYPAHPHAKKDRKVRIRPSVTGGPVRGYAVVRGKLPKGLKMNKRTGLIYGKPTKVTTRHTVTVAATGPKGQIISAIPFSVKVTR